MKSLIKYFIIFFLTVGFISIIITAAIVISSSSQKSAKKIFGNSVGEVVVSELILLDTETSCDSSSKPSFFKEGTFENVQLGNRSVHIAVE